MKVEKIERRKGIETNKKLSRAYNKMQGLIEALSTKHLPSKEIESVNEHIILINSFQGTERELIKVLKKAYLNILNFIEEKLNYVPKHYYRSRWMVFGLLAASAFSTVLSNLDFMGWGSSASIGLSMGMLIGLVIGTHFDKQAELEGRQLEMETTDY